MFKLLSIKNLLQLWSLMTILAIFSIAIMAVYTNYVFSETQRNVTEKVLPMEDASRQISAISAAFINRQNQIAASTSLESINNVISRKKLEAEFEQHWQRITLLLPDIGADRKIIDSLLDYYQRFLQIDSKLWDLTVQRHIMQERLKNRSDELENLQAEIQNEVEAISGRINLAVSRDKRVIRLSMNDNTILASNELVKRILFGEQSEIQNLAQSVRLNVLNIVNLTQKILQADNTDNLRSIRDNKVKQHQIVLTYDVNKLKQKLRKHTDLLVMTRNLEGKIHRLIQSVVDDNNSIYQLRIQQLKNTQLLVLEQQHSNIVLNVIMAKINELSTLVSDNSLRTVIRTIRISENAAVIIIMLSLMVIFGMILFVRGLSNRINTPLLELRSAVDALSEGKFETRLKVINGKSEFAALAIDFNRFAANTQKLISDLDRAKDELQLREKHISTILQGVPEAILTLSSEGVIESSNPMAEKILKADESILVGLKLTHFFDEQQNVFTLSDIERGLKQSQEFVGKDYNNQQFSMWLSLNRITSIGGDVWVCVISDISAWKKAEKDLKTTSSELDTILENAMVGIAFLKDRKILRVNHKFEQLFACDRALIEGKSARVLYPSDEIYDQLGDEGYAELAQGKNYVSEVRLVRQDGSLFWGLISGKANDPSKPQDGSIWLFEDITTQREKDEELRELASLDPLTGLANRAVFNDRLEHAIHKAHRNSTKLAVFFLDLDHFKQINDSLGHKSGDILLCEVADRLKSCVREGDTVARLGGDEFTLILEDISSVKYVAKVAEKIFDALSQLYELGTMTVEVTPSIGISLYPIDGRDLDLLLRNADAAMYYAKERGRNNFQFYSAEMNAQAAERLAMQNSLRRAVDNNEFYLNFQPQISLETGKIVGAEALLRWSSKEWGEVSPADFIPILEDIGLVSIVGEFVLQQACDVFMTLKELLEPNFLMAVNLSGHQFKGGQLASFIRQLLADKNMNATNLELEITETVLMDDFELAVTTLNELSDMNISLAIDDFGTGYSSLSYLKKFPLNVLKIDRSFIRDINDDEDDAAIVDAILAMSRRLKLDVVAEGVETKEQLSFLQEHGCQTVQGYFFSKPLDFDRFSDFVKQNKKYI